MVQESRQESSHVPWTLANSTLFPGLHVWLSWFCRTRQKMCLTTFSRSPFPGPTSISRNCSKRAHLGIAKAHFGLNEISHPQIFWSKRRGTSEWCASIGAVREPWVTHSRRSMKRPWITSRLRRSNKLATVQWDLYRTYQDVLQWVPNKKRLPCHVLYSIFGNLLLHTPLPWRLQSCNLLTAYSELHTQHAPSVANAVMTFPNIPRQLRYDTMIDLWRLRSLAVGSNSIVVSSGEPNKTRNGEPKKTEKSNSNEKQNGIQGSEFDFNNAHWDIVSHCFRFRFWRLRFIQAFSQLSEKITTVQAGHLITSGINKLSSMVGSSLW